MAGMIGSGRAFRQQGMAALGQAADMETSRNITNQQVSAQERAGTLQAVGMGAGVGGAMAAGTSVGGPMGAAIGAGVGLLASAIF